MPNHASFAKRLSVTSSILLLIVFFIYCGIWIGNNSGLLFDSKLHNEDVRSHILPFHRFGPEKLLDNDPIANERLSMDPIGVRLLYRILVLITGIYTSPKVVRFADHPAIGIGIPFWTGRATMDNYETLLPWFEISWKRQVQRTQDTFRALYATDTHSLLIYCQNYRITHFFLRRTRYNSSFKETAILYDPRGEKRWKLFEPFKSYVVSFLEPIEKESLVLANLFDEAIIFSKGDIFILDIKSFLNSR